MPILDRLGNSDSRPGNMSLGEGAFYNGNTYDETPSNTLSLTQQVVCQKVISLPASNALSLAGLATLHGSYAEPASSTLSLSQSATNVHQGRGDSSNTLTLVSTAGVKHYWKIDVGQSIAINQSVAPAASLLRQMSQSLTLTQRANFSMPYTITQSLTLSHLVTVIYSKFAANALALSQTVSFKRVVNQTVLDDTLVPKFAGSPPHPQVSGMSQSLGLHRSTNQPPTSILGVGQQVHVQVSKAQQASNVLTLTQEMYQIRTDENEPQALVLAQSVGVQKRINISVHHTLNLGSSTHVNGTPITLSVTHTLVFKQSHDKPTGIPAMPVVTIPSGYVVKVPDVRPPDPCYPYRGKLTLLEIPGTSVILPTAEFNDSQSYNGRVSIKRAMNGKRRVYHRKMGIAQKLHYDFIIDRRKAIELRQFIIQANSVPIKLTNWKGEVWTVLLTNSPLTFTEESYWGPGSGASSGNKSSISLEFEGARIN